jgi:hypothetical protein
MSDQGKANYEAYREVAGRPGVSAQPLPEYERLPMELRYAFDAGAHAVEARLADAPVDEDMPGNEPFEIDEHRWYAVIRHGGKVVRVIGYRGDSGISCYGSVAEWEAAADL